jgi:hypothetical protein
VKMHWLMALAAASILTACVDSEDQTASTVIPLPVPLSPDDLHVFLVQQGHADWSSESEVRTSENGSKRIVFFNSIQVQSFEEGLSEQAVGSASVREMYESDGQTLQGLAAIIKVSKEGRPSDWFFYETFEPVDGGKHAIAENGAPGCVNCHAAGHDYVRSSFPLR